eukprot:6698967-Lingulodinium_polyedra.AAC.1
MEGENRETRGAAAMECVFGHIYEQLSRDTCCAQKCIHCCGAAHFAILALHAQTAAWQSTRGARESRNSRPQRAMERASEPHV